MVPTPSNPGGPADHRSVSRTVDVAGSDSGAGGIGGRPVSHRPGLRMGRFPGIRWTRMLLIGTVAFALWTLLDAPSLQRSAIESPVGTRRTVSMDVVGPLAALSRGIGLSHLVGWTDQALGRTPGGGPPLAAVTAGGQLPRDLRRSADSKETGAAAIPTTTTTVPVFNQHPTPAQPLRVLVVGDSIGLDLGQPLVNDLAATGVIRPTLDGREDTGLSRPDYFDWPAELRVDLANDHPQLVVVMIGANDPQSLVGGDTSIPFGAPGWNAGYGQRVGAFIDDAASAGARVLWVGMPPMAAPQLNGEMQTINSVVQMQIDARPHVATYLSSSSVLADSQGNFTAYLPNASGAEVNIRTVDGIHLSPGGGELLSQAVIASIRSTLHVDLPG